MNANNYDGRNLLNELKKSKRLTINQKIQIAQLQNETERLEIDKLKSKTERTLWTKNFPIIITAIISLAAVLVSYTDVLKSNSQKDKESEIIKIKNQKDAELELAKIETDKELAEKKLAFDNTNLFMSVNKIFRPAVKIFASENLPSVKFDNYFSALEKSSQNAQTEIVITKTQTIIIPSEQRKETYLKKPPAITPDKSEKPLGGSIAISQPKTEPKIEPLTDMQSSPRCML